MFWGNMTEGTRGVAGFHGESIERVTRRRFLKYVGAGSALASLGFLAGCGGGENAAASGPDPDSIELEGPVEIDFWHIQATIYGEAISEIVRRFNQENEYGITVKEIFQGEYEALNEKVRASLQGGGLPDVSMAYEADTLEYMKSGSVVPLDRFLSSKKYGLSEGEIDDIAQGVLERQRVEAYDGKTMSWPHGNSSEGLYYNVDVLREAGFEEPAGNWGEFMGQIREIKAQTDLPSLPFAGFLNGLLYNIMRSEGVDPWKEDASASNFTAPEAVKALGMIRDMFDEKLAYLAVDSEQEFTNGRAAMEMGTTARTSSKIELVGDAFEWGIMLTPQGDAPEPITALYGGNQILFDNDDEQRLLAGWIFMRYFADTEAQSIYAERTGYFPATLSALKTDLLSKDYKKNPQKRQAFEDVYTVARIYSPNAAVNSINDMVEDTLTELIRGRVGTREAADTMKEEADNLLEEMA